MINSLGIIIVVHGQLFYTKKLLDSIASHKFSECKNLYVCVVDNASDEPTQKYLESWLLEQNSKGSVEKRIVHWSKTNLGYGPALNVGMDVIFGYDSAADILCMNNDMELIDGCLDELIRAAYSAPDIGIVGGKLLFPDNTIQHGGAFLSVWGWGQHKHGRRAAEEIPFEKIEDQEYVTGALFYIKKEVIDKIGRFDSLFAPAYFEEVDLCYEARNKGGYRVVYTPFAKAYHYENVTSKDVYKNLDAVNQVSRTNQVKFYLKHDNDIYPPESDKQLLICSKIYGDWSFCIVMRNLAKGLQRAGVDVSIAPEEYHTPGNMPDWEIKRMINKPNDYWNRYVLRSSEGDHMYLMPPGKKRIAHTTGESSKVLRPWKDQLNHVDQVLTTSTFFRDVLLESGVTTRIDILPNSVDTALFNPSIEKNPIPGLRGFNFYSVFHFGERKAPELLIQAFAREFSEDEDVSLTIHSLSMEYVITRRGSDISTWINTITQGKKRPPILITTDPIQDVFLPGFCKNFDVFILASRAEGFGNPVIEAGALGIPSIVTGYSGVLDFVDNSTGWRIDYTLEDIPLQVLPYFRNYVGGKWARPSVEHLQQLMRYAYEHRDEVEQKGKAAFEKSQAYSIESIGKLARELIFER